MPGRTQVTWMIWLRTILSGLLFVALFLVFIPRWIVAGGREVQLVTGVARYAAALLVGAGGALVLWCWYEFVTRGRGTPVPIDTPRHLVVVGPYRFVRNPMYVAALLIILGQAILYAAPSLVLYAAAFTVATHVFVVLYEEPTLARLFGAEYDAYRAAVGRWMPRLRPYEHRAPG